MAHSLFFEHFFFLFSDLFLVFGEIKIDGFFMREVERFRFEAGLRICVSGCPLNYLEDIRIFRIIETTKGICNAAKNKIFCRS